ncbi:AI-2E family transporter [Spirosoma sp. KUDC1026]|uniref:AI-2E family transporter n=1 Tax=Spirosoma sp. KUDC1026 TaxID=2745947 RepID=UPI00159B9476|nr:AI-2E family transporter [Spirosoma sp. KUDC1026]QKZ15603.1 AI-2E family transporter [Spirosoma sp. KUDC1026]
MEVSNASNSEGDKSPFVKRTLIVISLVTLTVLILALAYIGLQVLFLVLASVLLALPLRAGTRLLSRKTKLPEGASLAVVLLSVVAVIYGVIALLSGAISQQISDLQEQLPELIENAQQQLSQSKLGQRIASDLSADDINIQKMASQGNWFGRAFGAVSSVFGVLSNLYIVFFVTLFIAVSPDTYYQGVILLVPMSGRERAHEVMANLGDTLLSWLTGQVFSMTVVGVLTGIGLWILGIPLAGVLALMAALLSFIPNFGPVLALIPAALVALVNGPEQVLYVAALYAGVQAVESNLITPLVQQELIEMPPALILVAQVVIGTFAGAVGVIFATPVVAIIMVLVKMLYIRDGLGDTSVKV